MAKLFPKTHLHLWALGKHSIPTRTPHPTPHTQSDSDSPCWQLMRIPKVKHNSNRADRYPFVFKQLSIRVAASFYGNQYSSFPEEHGHCHHKH